MDTEELIGPDLILLLLGAPTRWEVAQNRINGITRLEKLMFLISEECTRELSISEPFDFVPYQYGPYSKEVYEAVELLEEAGLLEEQRNITDSELDRAEELLYSDMTAEISYERQFLLTPDGQRVAQYLATIHPKLNSRIGQLKDRYAALSLQNLIYHVYTQYPDSARNSIIRDRIVPSPT